MGAALGHCLVAYESTLKGLSRLEVNEAVITADLLDRWEVLAEAVQTVMRRYGGEEPYEQLKAPDPGPADGRSRLSRGAGRTGYSRRRPRRARST